MYRLDLLSRLGCFFICDRVIKYTQNMTLLSGNIIYAKQLYPCEVKIYNDGRAGRVTKILGNHKQKKYARKKINHILSNGIKYNVNGIRHILFELIFVFLSRLTAIFLSGLLALVSALCMFFINISPYFMYFFVSMLCFFFSIMYQRRGYSVEKSK